MIRNLRHYISLGNNRGEVHSHLLMQFFNSDVGSKTRGGMSAMQLRSKCKFVDPNFSTLAQYPYARRRFLVEMADDSPKLMNHSSYAPIGGLIS